ncbi:integrin-linked kinase-associated serine/threonine phosphatase 2C-like isoform X3 [Tachypleus tridentatus]|uniref:integrin-linked kinase-associated serine/threonine phosphatase 2C-like isoform X3 n=1 Tax=Tachypleus tridentatus TaxID=6853 RepID=UPI003FD3E3ED
MDLFGDLPEPSDILKHSNTNGSSVDGLFGDLPSPSSTNKMTDKLPAKRKIQDDEKQETKKPALGLYQLHGYYYARKGEREMMQDAHVINDAFHKTVPNLHPSIYRLAYYAVFDGHGGVRASQFSAAQLHQYLTAKLPKGDLTQVEKEIKRCLIETFKKTDEEFLKEASKHKPSWKDGTTAITVLAINNTLYIANLGDSKAILCRYNEQNMRYTAIPLSKDHSPTDYEERMRIQKAGGYVKDGRVLGVLEVSRSIGDGQFKTAGVISLPDVRRCQLTDNDRFLLLACDGLWKVFTSDEVVQKVLADIQDDGAAAKEKQVFSNYEGICGKLVNEALRKLSGDNVTVVIVGIEKSEPNQ